LGWIVTIIISVSTIAALTLTPMLSSMMLRQNPKRSKSFMFFYSPIEKGLDALDNGYERLLRWAVNYRYVVIAGAAGIFIFSLVLLSRVGTDFFPESDNSQIGITVELLWDQGLSRPENSMSIFTKNGLKNTLKLKYFRHHSGNQTEAMCLCL